jgi:hypothetical protein
MRLGAPVNDAAASRGSTCSARTHGSPLMTWLDAWLVFHGKEKVCGSIP